MGMVIATSHLEKFGGSHNAENVKCSDWHERSAESGVSFHFFAGIGNAR